MKPLLYIVIILNFLSGCNYESDEIVPTIFSKDEVKEIENLISDFANLTLEFYQFTSRNDDSYSNTDLFEASLNNLASEILIARYCSDDESYFQITEKFIRLFEKYEQTTLSKSIWNISKYPFSDEAKESYKRNFPSQINSISNSDYLYSVNFKWNSKFIKFLKIKSESHQHYASYYETVSSFMAVAPALDAGFPRNIWRFDFDNLDDRFLLTIHFLSIWEKWE